MIDGPDPQDASDCVDFADELAARFRTLQRHEEAAYVSRQQYDDNLHELRALLDALTAYVIAPAIGPHAFMTNDPKTGTIAVIHAAGN